MEQSGDRTPDRDEPVRLRYWAALRAAAGVDTEQVAAGTLTDVLDAARQRHRDSERFAKVLSICSVLVAEQPVGARDHAEVTVPPGATVDLLPPFAGGC